MRLIAAVVATCAIAASASASAVDQKKVDDLFRSAMVSARGGNHAAAIPTFRHLLSGVSSPRIKLELARSLLAVGEYKEAYRLFRDVYEAPGTPMTVKRNILPFLEEAELRTLRVRYGVRVITDSNPSRVGEGGTVYFNGIPMEYKVPAPKEVAYGIEPWVAVEKLWDNGLLTKIHSSARLFEDTDLMAGRSQFSVARNISSVPGMFVQVNFDTEVNNENSFVLPSVETWKRYIISDAADVGIGGQIGYMFAENSDVSGAYYRPYAFGSWTFLPNATAFANVSAEHLDSRNPYYSYTTPKLEMGLRYRAGQMEVTPHLRVSKTMFSEFDAFWGVRRKDTLIRPTLTVSHDSFEWNGFKPELSLFYEERNSNVDIYDYDQTGAFLNIRRLY